MFATDASHEMPVFSACKWQQIDTVLQVSLKVDFMLAGSSQAESYGMER